MTNLYTEEQDVVFNLQELVTKELTIVYNEFFKKIGILEPIVFIEDEVLPYLIIKNFPLPENIVIKEEEYKYIRREEDILFVLNNYPEQPPIGFYISKNSPNLKIFHKIFNNTISDKMYNGTDNISPSNNYIWVDFRYPSSRWNYNIKDIGDGDNLSKFFVLLYSKLAGMSKVPFLTYIDI